MSQQAEAASRVRSVATRIVDEVEKVIVGKRSVVENITIAMLCEGHVLLEDVPGLGKTMLARSLAAALGGQFSRVQFTPDLLPTDITGSMVFDPRTAEFTYREGPVVTNVLLADEINRAGPRTQSALLEAMEERRVSVERHPVQLPRPFIVLATQNPVELEGTFPLPEAQMDRFLMRLSIGYPDFEDEREMLRRFRSDQPVDHVQAVTSPDEMNALIQLVRLVHVSDVVEDYALRVVRDTRDSDRLEVGASPRAAIALVRASQAHAALAGREFVKPDDVRAMAPHVLAHRLMLGAEADILGEENSVIMSQILDSVPVPVEVAQTAE